MQAWDTSVIAGTQSRGVVDTWREIEPDKSGDLRGDVKFTNVPSTFNVAPGTSCGTRVGTLRGLTYAFHFFEGNVTSRSSPDLEASSDFVDAM